jgi:hypothetical protein
LNLNISSMTRDPATIGIADFLARAPGMSSISTTSSVLAAVQAGTQQHWYSYQAGWQDYSQVEVTLSADAQQLTVKAVADNGQSYQGTVPMNHAGYVKRLANSGNSHLVRIDASPQQLGLQPLGAVPVVTVTSLTTSDTTPRITGTVSNGTLQVTVAGQTYPAAGNDLQVSGTNWALQIPENHALDLGTYTVTATAVNTAGNAGTNTGQLVIVPQQSNGNGNGSGEGEGEAFDSGVGRRGFRGSSPVSRDPGCVHLRRRLHPRRRSDPGFEYLGSAKK